jgi:hypothetical protein
MDRPTKSDILVIKGVYAEDFETNKSVYSKVKSCAPTCDYIPLPKLFTSADEWKKIHSNLICWECNLGISGYPKFVPTNPRVEGGADVCDPLGAFCEWGCVVRYITTIYPKIKAVDLLQSVSIFESKFTGRYREHIPMSISKTERKEYCGEGGLTVKEFREKNAQMDNEYQLLTFKMEHLQRKTADGK